MKLMKNVKIMINKIRINTQMRNMINMILVITCSIHICFISYNILYPEFPVIREYKKDLKEIDFPISFIFCVKENKNKNTIYQKYGYRDVTDYFEGVNMFNNSIVGCSGHRKNGSTFESAESDYDDY